MGLLSLPRFLGCQAVEKLEDAIFLVDQTLVNRFELFGGYFEMGLEKAAGIGCVRLDRQPDIRFLDQEVG